jgi:hypothetical protein
LEDCLHEARFSLVVTAIDLHTTASMRLRTIEL